jgi:UDP-N-acetylglucosamine--N-acetylmuramyl-(pentapeptide) pyrophosphoryl-undecaprenol N-acetylglucosamine transferase
MTNLRVLIVGGGTGGHVIPALAIAEELRGRYGAEVRFVGTPRGFETKLVPAAGYALELIQVGQLKGVSLATRLRTLLDLPLGVRRCFEILNAFRPHVVVGVGGYASGPGMVAALLKRIPTLAFEPNAAPGLANRLVGKRVSAAAVSFAPACAYFRNAKVTGIPVRKEFFEVEPLLGELAERVRPGLQHIPPNDSAYPSTVNLLVFGGSQGARILNELLPRIVSPLLKMVADLFILHQSGAKHEETTRAAYLSSGADPSRWAVHAFLEDMPRRFAWSTLILSRSGASTVAELCAAGRPALLIPFPQATDDHQRKNAEVLVSAQAAEMRLEDELDEARLSSHLSCLLLQPALLAQMGLRAKALAKPDGAAEIGAMVVDLAERKRQAG